MKKQIVILALSEKWGEKCVAAYDITSQKIIRLVSNQAGGGIPNRYTNSLSLLDIVEADLLQSCPLEHQTENVLVSLHNGLKKIRAVNSSYLLPSLAGQYPPVFGDTSYKLENAADLDHSLEVIEFESMTFSQSDSHKTKADFKAGGKQHRYYAVTDRRYFNSFQSIQSGFAVISLPPSDSFTRSGGGYYKYVSAIYPKEERREPM